MFGYKLTSKQENLQKDIHDLYEELLDKSDISKSSKSAAKLIGPFLPKIDRMDLSTKEGSDEYAQVIRDLGPVMERVGSLIMAAKQDIKEPGEWYSKIWTTVQDLFGFEDYKLIAEKYKDCLASYEEARKYVSKAKTMESQFASEKVSYDTFGFMGRKYQFRRVRDRYECCS